MCSGAMATAGVAGSFLTTQRSTPRRCARARATQRPRARPTPSLPNLGTTKTDPALACLVDCCAGREAALLSHARSFLFTPCPPTWHTHPLCHNAALFLPGMFSAATTTWTKVQIHQPSSRAASGNDGAGLGWASMQGAMPLPSKHSSQARVWEQGAISNRRRHGRPASNNASTRRALWGTTMPAFVQGMHALRCQAVC